MTIEELEVAIRDAGWQRPIVHGSPNNDYVALIIGRRWYWLVLSGRVAAVERLWRTGSAGLAVVATAAEVSEVLRAWGCI